MGISRMWLTTEDREILKYVEQYGSTTIHQVQNMFYNTQLKGYQMAQKHLAKLVGYSKLYVYKERNFNSNIYYMDKKASYHTVLIMNYYSELIKNGAKIIYFKREQEWMDKKYYSDAYCVYSVAGKVCFDLLEVVRAKTVETQKYLDIFESKEAHELSQAIYSKITGGKRLEGLFPRLVVMDDIQHQKELFINKDITTIHVDFQLTNITQLLFI